MKLLKFYEFSSVFHVDLDLDTDWLSQCTYAYSRTALFTHLQIVEGEKAEPST